MQKGDVSNRWRTNQLAKRVVFTGTQPPQTKNECGLFRHTTNFWARQDKRGRVGATGHTPPSKDSKLLQCHCHLSITHLHSHVHHPPSHTRWAPTTNPPVSEQHLPPPATCTCPPHPPHRSSTSNCYVADNVIFHWLGASLHVSSSFSLLDLLLSLSQKCSVLLALFQFGSGSYPFLAFPTYLLFKKKK